MNPTGAPVTGAPITIAEIAKFLQQLRALSRPEAADLTCDTTAERAGLTRR